VPLISLLLSQKNIASTHQFGRKKSNSKHLMCSQWIFKKY